MKKKYYISMGIIAVVIIISLGLFWYFLLASNQIEKSFDEKSIGKAGYDKEYYEKLKSGEEEQESIENVDDGFVCNSPYMKHGYDCCLDGDNNSICDEDEITNTETTTSGTTSTVGTTTSTTTTTTDDDLPSGPESISNTEFPYYAYVTKGDNIIIYYLGDRYNFMIDDLFKGTIKMASLKNGYSLFPTPHAYGEDVDELDYGRVNFYDTDNDGDTDLYFKTIAFGTGGALRITIDTSLVEICGNFLDDDSDGLIDCAETECGGALLGPEGDSYCQFKETICEDGYDNDGDGLVDCLDPHCSVKTVCLGQYCGEEIGVDDGIWVWSYLYGEDEDELPSEDAEENRRIGCCTDMHCVDINGNCVGRDGTSENEINDYICGDNNNWDSCGPLEDPDFSHYLSNESDGGNRVCTESDGDFYWEMEAIPVT